MSPYYASAVPHAKETVGGSLHDAQGLRQGQTLHFYLPTPVARARPPLARYAGATFIACDFRREPSSAAVFVPAIRVLTSF